MATNDLAGYGIMTPFMGRQNAMLPPAPAAPAPAPGAQPGITAPFVQQATATPGHPGAAPLPGAQVPQQPGVLQPIMPGQQPGMPGQVNQLAPTIQRPFAGGSIYGG